MARETGEEEEFFFRIPRFCYVFCWGTKVNYCNTYVSYGGTCVSNKHIQIEI